MWVYSQAPGAGRPEAGTGGREDEPADGRDGAARVGLGAQAPCEATAAARQGRIIIEWHFSDDWIGSPQDRCRYPSFRSLCYFGAGLDTDRAASLFGVDADTIASWGAADQAPPQVWRTLLALAGEFEAVNAAWKGWRIHKGKLHAPDLADGFTPGRFAPCRSCMARWTPTGARSHRTAPIRPPCKSRRLQLP